jgi:amino acid transporter
MQETTPAAGPASPPAPEIDGLYARKSSGLVRELGIRDVFSVSIGSINTVGTAVFLIVFLSIFPRTDFTVPFLAGAVGAVLLALVYAQLMAAMPRSGGDYVFASRIFHPIFGAALGGAVFLALVLAIAPNPTVFPTLVLPFFLQAVGGAFGSATIAGWSDNFVGKDAQLVVALLYLGAAFLVGTRSVRIVTKSLYWMFGLGAVAVLILIALFAFHSNTEFQAAYNEAAGKGSAYAAAIDAARAAGFQPGVSTSVVIATIPFGGLTFLGLTFAVFPGGEVKRPASTFLMAGTLAIIATLVVALGFWLAIKGSAGRDFLQSVGFLSANDPDALSKASSVNPVPASYGLVLAGDPVSKLLAGLGILAGSFANVLAIILAISRILFALSFDRLLPAWTTDVNPRTHAPTKSTAIAAGAIAIFTALGIYTSVLSVFRNFVLIFEVIFVIASVAAAILPYRRRDLYAASPKLFGRVAGVPAITVIGVVSAVANGIMAYLAATKPEISGGYDVGSVVTLVAVALVGVLAYGMSRVVLGRRGVDLSLAMRELPPD